MSTPIDNDHRSELGALSAALRRITHALDSHSRQQARVTGLTSPQALAIAELAASEYPLATGELAARLSLSQATTTELALRLEARGLILRQRSMTDRRKTELTLTPSGHAALASEAGMLPAGFQRQFSSLSVSRRKRLVASLLELAQIMSPGVTHIDTKLRNHVRNTRRNPIQKLHVPITTS